jgi:hypothetical protein
MKEQFEIALAHYKNDGSPYNFYAERCKGPGCNKANDELEQGTRLQMCSKNASSSATVGRIARRQIGHNIRSSVRRWRRGQKRKRPGWAIVVLFLSMFRLFKHDEGVFRKKE